MRRAGLWSALMLVAGQGTAFADEIIRARLTEPTTRYEHGVFGSQTTWGAMEVSVNTCIGCAGVIFRTVTFTLAASRVYEDRAARVRDLDGDGQAEVIVVETDRDLGASLAIYDSRGKRAATDFIGAPRRWLAPAGVGDFDGDGRVEIAYVDRPHLVKELVFVRYDKGVLTEIARVPGFTNHRFGDPEISGGVQSCAGQDRLIVASADWRRIFQVTLDAGVPRTRDIGPMGDLAQAMECP